jgi:LacI family transcriptional regulator
VVPVARDQSYFRTGAPAVCLDRPATNADADLVTTDNFAGALEATAHLRVHRHKRIAYLGDHSGLATAKERLAGYRKAMGTIDFDGDLVQTDLDNVSKAEDATTELLDRAAPPTAIFASQNLVATGAVRSLLATGAYGKTALIVFDEVSFAEILRPQVSVVAQNVESLALNAVSMLAKRIADPGSPVRTVRVPARLVARGSGEIFAPD